MLGWIGTAAALVAAVITEGGWIPPWVGLGAVGAGAFGVLLAAAWEIARGAPAVWVPVPAPPGGARRPEIRIRRIRPAAPEPRPRKEARGEQVAGRPATCCTAATSVAPPGCARCGTARDGEVREVPGEDPRFGE